MSDLADRIEKALSDGYRVYSEVEPLLREAMNELRAETRQSESAPRPLSHGGEVKGALVECWSALDQLCSSMAELRKNLLGPLPEPSRPAN